MKRPIYDKLLQFQQEDRYPFHMPGHKRKLENELSDNMFGWDITEIDGFDELHDPEGIIKESMEELCEFYHTEQTWYLVNGSSCGNLAAMGGGFQRGDEILVARNCHKSVYHGIELFGLKPCYVYPDSDNWMGIYNGISPEQIEEKLRRYRKIKGVFLTSPTYEGVVSDIKAISRVCKQYGAILIVDEAHGAHFPYSNYFPESAVTRGADIVIQSLHKTMAVPNQGALLHLCSKRVNQERLNRYQSMFQTTSPSYLLLASMEYGIAHGRENKGLWDKYEMLLERYRRKWDRLTHLYLVSEKDFEKKGCFDYDKGKLVFGIKPEIGNKKDNNLYQKVITGKEIAGILLKKYHLQMEMSEKNYLIAMTSYMDEEEGFLRLDRALEELDRKLEENSLGKGIWMERVLKNSDLKENNQKRNYLKNSMSGEGKVEEEERALLPGEALDKKRIWVKQEEAVGRIAGDYVYLYPPGSPILVPGEKINAKVLEKIQEYLYNNMEVKGVLNNHLCIINEDNEDYHS